MGGDGSTYIASLIARLELAGARPVLRHAGRDVGASELLGMIFRYARALAGLGIGRGSLVALFAPNRPEALAVRYAAHLLDAAATFLPVPPSEDRCRELVALTAPSLLVLFTETAPLLPAAGMAPVAVVGPGLPDTVPRLDAIAAAQRADPLPCLARPEDLAVIVTSGGTTGVPKGSWRSFAAYSALVQVPSPEDRRQLVNGRLAYLSQILVDTTLLGGGLVVLEDGYDAARTLAVIEALRITDLFLVEPQLFEVMDHKDAVRRDLTSLRAVNHIGASAPPTLRLRARVRLGPVIAHTYGASEMGLVSALAPGEHDLGRPELFSSAGRVRPGVAVRFRRQDGTLAGQGEIGSIEVSSPALAGGYHSRPELEAAAFQDGWYRSGDLGRLDGEGYLHILGRAVDAAWIDGALVTPTMVEDTLCRLAAVRYAVVVAEAVRWIAALVPWPGDVIDAGLCAGAVRAAHGIDTLVFCQERIPLTEQGKPDRAAIRRLAPDREGTVP